MQSLPLPARAELMARHAAAFLGFSIPISVALDNVLLALMAVLWLAGGELRRKLADIAANPVALAALALFGMMAVGLLYGSRYPGDGLRYLGKYLDLLFIPIFITLLRDARMRDLALRWFGAAMVLTFMMVEIKALGLLDGNAILPRAATFPGVFRHSTTHGLLSAFAAFVFALWAWREPQLSRRILFSVLALIAIKNVLFVAVSRTAYIALALLSIYFFFIAFRGRRIWVAVLALVALFAAAYIGSPIVNDRVNTVAAEITDWRSGLPSASSSVGLRLDWYLMSLEVVRDHPVLGAGTGSLPRIYAERAHGSPTLAIHNPHSEYLLIAAQTGLIGLALLMHLFVQQVRVSGSLATPDEMRLARGVAVVVAVGCLFNSLLLDHTEGLLYAWFTGMLCGGLRSPPSPAAGGAR